MQIAGADFVVIFSDRIDIRSQLSAGEHHFLVTGRGPRIFVTALSFAKDYS